MHGAFLGCGGLRRGVFLLLLLVVAAMAFHITIFAMHYGQVVSHVEDRERALSVGSVDRVLPEKSPSTLIAEPDRELMVSTSRCLSHE